MNEPENPLRIGEKSFDYKFRMGLTTVQQMICVDQAKGNLFYLLEPRVDTEGIDAALNNPIAESIHRHMDKNTRSYLQQLPLKFLDYWLDIDKGFGTIQGSVMSNEWAHDYKKTMTERAHAAQTRILGVVEEGNVKRVNFARSSGVTPLQDAAPTVDPPTTSDAATTSGLLPRLACEQKLDNFVDNGDGTVTDARTGLMWMRYVLGQTWDGYKPVGNWRDHPWAEAVALRHSFAGHDDWRLPTVDELETIVELNHQPPFDAAAFPNTMPFSCWTASPYDGRPTHAWSVDFKTGGRKCTDRRESHLVRLVRQMQSSTLPELGVAQADTAKDMPTDVALADDPALAEVAEAQFKLGNKFYDGDGVKRDYEKAAECYLESAQKGHAKSQHSLAIMYWYGFGVPQDKQKTAEWYMRAAEQGLTIAQNNLAGSYLIGSGVPQDDTKAAEWYLRAADQGDADAQYSLAELFEKGRGVPQDDQRAKALYLQAALQDNEAAQCWLWKRAHLENTRQPALLMASTTTGASDEGISKLPTESALAVVRAAIDLLKHNPTAFSPELADLRALLLGTGEARVVQNDLPNPSKVKSIPAGTENPVIRVARWLSGLDSIGSAELRSHLLPLDLLPAALIDEINEKALELTGEAALEENDDEFVVHRSVLAQVLRAEE